MECWSAGVMAEGLTSFSTLQDSTTPILQGIDFQKFWIG
jgi:hypothetical protein